jgi:hypothetical protein
LENLFIKGANKRLEIRVSEQSGRGIFALQNISPGILIIMEKRLILLDMFIKST